MLLLDEPRKWFLEIKSTRGEDVVKTVETTTNDSQYHITGDSLAVQWLGLRAPTAVGQGSIPG